MKGHKVILGEFEDELSAEIARRELITAGINSSIFNKRTAETSSTMQYTERVKLIIIDTQLEESGKILITKFI
jgi:hypothetical protein